MEKNLFIFGFGYTAQNMVPFFIEQGYRVFGTSRSKILREALSPEVTLFSFDKTLLPTLNTCSYVLSCIPPDNGTDPVLTHFHEALLSTPWLGYLSSTSVYGNHNGAWVTEESLPQELSYHAQQRLTIEQQWRSDLPQTHVFRLAGIYGPKRNALEKIQQGKDYAIVKPNHYFSRIHVHDIAKVLLASMSAPTPGELFNVADDCPAPSHEVDDFSATLLKVPPLKHIPIEEAHLSPRMHEFFEQNKKVNNQKIKEYFNLSLRFPSYQEGLHYEYDELLRK